MKTTTLILSISLLAACAEGNDDRDDGMADASGSVGSADSTTGSDTDPTATTATTAPTTAETLSTTASTDAESSSDGGPGETTDTGSDLSCSEYCDVYLSGCADFNEYANEQDCLDNCAQWPVGQVADTGSDSLGCRTYHAGVAASTDASLHCPHAGPNGAETCVSPTAPTCDAYCSKFFDNCTGALNTYSDEMDCLDQCASWYPGTAADMDGHTIGCHTYHAGAAEADPQTHCPHAGAGGGGICVL